MLTDSDIVPECIIAPRSFGALMALYESNFIKFSRLADSVSEEAGRFFCSKVSEDCDLYLTVESVARYTHVMRLTYRITGDELPVADPDLTVRIYVDARMTEVSSWASHHRHAELRTLARRFKREFDKRWSRNMMLSKWLDYLIDKGHAFRPIQPTAVPAQLLEGTSAS